MSATSSPETFLSLFIRILAPIFFNISINLILVGLIQISFKRISELSFINAPTMKKAALEGSLGISI